MSNKIEELGVKPSYPRPVGSDVVVEVVLDEFNNIIAENEALISHVESQQQEIDRLKAENEKLRELAHATANIRFPAKCPHGAEAWYCDGCRLEWERLVHDAVVKACEVLGE